MSLHESKLPSLKDKQIALEAERLEKDREKLEKKDEEKKIEIKKKAKKN